MLKTIHGLFVLCSLALYALPAFSVDPDSTNNPLLKKFLTEYHTSRLDRFPYTISSNIDLAHFFTPEQLSKGGLSLKKADLVLTKDSIGDFQVVYNKGDWDEIYDHWLVLVYGTNVRPDNLNDSDWVGKRALILDVPGKISVKCDLMVGDGRGSSKLEECDIDTAVSAKLITKELAETIKLFAAVDRFSEMFHAGDYLFQYAAYISIAPSFNNFFAENYPKHTYKRKHWANEAMIMAMIKDYEILPLESDFAPVYARRFLEEDNVVYNQLLSDRKLALNGKLKVVPVSNRKP